MHLVYVYCGSNRILKDREFIFDSTYDIHFDKDVLFINRKEGCPNDFWGKKIKYLTCIVGENGTGKTSTLWYILRRCTFGYEDSPKELNDGFLIYANEDDTSLSIYKGVNVNFNIKTDNKIDIKYERPLLKSVFYSQLDSSVGPSKRIELNGCSLICDNWLKYSDIEVRLGLGYNRNNSYVDHIESYDVQNKKRIVRFLIDYQEKIDVLDINIPKYLNIKLNDREWCYFRSYGIDCQGRITLNADANSPLLRFEYSYFWNEFMDYARVYSTDSNIQQQWLELLKDYNSYISDNLLTDKQSLLDLTRKFTQNYGFSYLQKNLDPQLRKPTIEFIKKAVDNSIEKIKYIKDNCSFSDTDFFYLEISKEENKEIVSNIFDNNKFPLCQSLDIEYAYAPGQDCILSTGELQFFNLLSRLYDKLKDTSEKEDIKLVLIDEAEVGYHPNWQRMFLYFLVQFFDTLKGKYQLILTTHSPIVLSDIPRNCIQFLSDNISDGIKKTFCSNIFDLYKDGFFLKSPVGEFCGEKVKDLFCLYKKKELWSKNFNFSYYKYIIENIGDPYIASEAKRIFMEICTELGKNEDLKKMLQKEIEERQALLNKL